MNNTLDLGKFDKVDESTFSEEVRDLYKARYDPSQDYYKHLEVFKSYMINDRTFNTRSFFKPYPKCHVWEEMTEEERMEKGLTTKREAFFNSISGMLILSGLIHISMIQYNRIFTPKSPILRSLRKVSWFEYLKQRIPIYTTFSVLFYFLVFIKYEKMINYFDSDEADYDRILMLANNKV